MADVKILIATHKKFVQPKGDCFLPIHVGKEDKEDLGFIGDNTGEQISKKNNTFCELTGLYWAWKNLDYEVLGLCHYRRYFDLENKKDRINYVRYITQKELESYTFSTSKVEEYLKKYDVILPKPKIYETSLEKDYGYCHSVEDFEILTSVINSAFPDYSKTWQEISYFSNKLTHANMFIAPKKISDVYLDWLFAVLFEVEKKVKLSPYKYQQRVFGFMAERLLTLYFTHNRFKIKMLPVLYVKDDDFPYKTPSKIVTVVSNWYKNFIFFLTSFPRKVKEYS